MKAMIGRWQQGKTRLVSYYVPMCLQSAGRRNILFFFLVCGIVHGALPYGLGWVGTVLYIPYHTYRTIPYHTGTDSFFFFCLFSYSGYRLESIYSSMYIHVQMQNRESQICTDDGETWLLFTCILGHIYILYLYSRRRNIYILLLHTW